MRPHSRNAGSWGFEVTPHIAGIARTVPEPGAASNGRYRLPRSPGGRYIHPPRSTPCPVHPERGRERRGVLGRSGGSHWARQRPARSHLRQFATGEPARCNRAEKLAPFGVQEHPRVPQQPSQPIYGDASFSWEPVRRHKPKHKTLEGDFARDPQLRQPSLLGKHRAPACAHSSRTSPAPSPSSLPTPSYSHPASCQGLQDYRWWMKQFPAHPQTPEVTRAETEAVRVHQLLSAGTPGSPSSQAGINKHHTSDSLHPPDPSLGSISWGKRVLLGQIRAGHN